MVRKNLKIYSSREKLFEEFIDKTSEIQILEFGVFRGNSINFLAKLISSIQFGGKYCNIFLGVLISLPWIMPNLLFIFKSFA